MMQTHWTTICTAANVSAGAAYACEVAGQMLAVYLVEGQYYATENVCPHAYALLSDGWLESKEIECPLHSARFNIETGAVLQGPAECGVNTYPVRLEGEYLQCLLPA